MIGYLKSMNMFPSYLNVNLTLTFVTRAT